MLKKKSFSSKTGRKWQEDDCIAFHSAACYVFNACNHVNQEICCKKVQEIPDPACGVKSAVEMPILFIHTLISKAHAAEFSPWTPASRRQGSNQSALSSSLMPSSSSWFKLPDCTMNVHKWSSPTFDDRFFHEGLCRLIQAKLLSS